VGGIPIPTFDNQDGSRQIYLLVTVDLHKPVGK
jgi:hypothetical protein